ncbi:hypothetical protein R6Q59_011748 [Mikania micrantha]
MVKQSSICVFLLLALAVVVTALVAGVNGQDRRASKAFPPEEEYDRDRRGSGGGGYDSGHGGGEGGRGKVFPPEEDYGRDRRGRGGYEGGRGGDEGGRGKVFPPEEEERGRGGRDFRPEEDQHGRGGGGRKGWTEKRRFILSDSKRVVATPAGGMRVVKGVGGKLIESPMHIGFITMEPNSMFIPQYMDSSMIMFVENGEARIGSIYKDELVEKDLRGGDLYRIQAGSPFYLVNTAQGQRLNIIACIDTAESSDWSPFVPFYIGGGTNPRSVLAGFDKQTLATAFNVSFDTIDEVLSSRQEGPIMFLNPDSESEPKPSFWSRFLEQGANERKMQMKRIVNVADKEAEMPTWSLNKFFIRLFGKNEDNDKLDSYNIYDKEANFRNDYGWSLEVDGDDYEPLKLSDFAVYLVNLTAGSMMAPHINPTATEYGVVLSGTGNIQVVFPNGTLAMDAQVSEGDVFWIPRYFPFCQVASRSSPFVFFGFSTSAYNNRPQFLAGRGSVLQTMMGPGFAAAFGLSEDQMSELINAQTQTTILPSASASPGGGGGEIPEGEGEGDPAKGGGKGQGDQADPAQGTEDQSGQGESGAGEAALLMEKMGSEIRMRKNSFAYNMAMGMD